MQFQNGKNEGKQSLSRQSIRVVALIFILFLINPQSLSDFVDSLFPKTKNLP